MNEMVTKKEFTDQRDKEAALPSEEYVVKALPSILGTADMTAIYVLAILWITNAATAASGGAVGYVYWTIGGLTFFVPSAIVVAQLGHIFPHEGSIYNWTHKTLGRYWGFFIGLLWWFPAPILMVSASDTIVTYLQGLNPNWLVEPWQQGVAIIIIVSFSSLIALQRARVVQNLVNSAAALILFAVALIGLAGVVWLLGGHASATSFVHPTDWSITPTNYNLFGLISVAYLGSQVPLNMGGEVAKRNAVTRHIFWGTVLVFVGYYIATFALLVVQGPANGSVPFALIATVDKVLGKYVASIVAICILYCFVLDAVIYNCSFARLLMVGSIDQRLPTRFGLLNKHRVPSNAILLQTGIAIAFAVVVFIIAPSISQLGKASDLTIEFYNVTLAMVTIIWALVSMFFYVDLLFLYRRDREKLYRQRIVPLWVLWISMALGPLTCLVAIFDALFYSWIPQIDNGHWELVVSSLIVVCLILAAVGSMIATSEASWEEMRG